MDGKKRTAIQWNLEGLRRLSVGGGESFTDHLQVASAIRSLLNGQTPGH